MIIYVDRYRILRIITFLVVRQMIKIEKEVSNKPNLRRKDLLIERSSLVRSFRWRAKTTIGENVR